MKTSIFFFIFLFLNAFSIFGIEKNKKAEPKDNLLVTHTLPILEITTDSLNLWGPKGIYDNPDHDGIEWEKPCHLKYSIKGVTQFEENAGLRIQGGTSVFMAKKSFRLFFKKVYGNGRLKYPIFGPDKLASFDKLVLKSGYDDDVTVITDGKLSGTLLRDAISLELWNKMGSLPQLSTWAILYLNNKYWGIYDIRESIDEHFIIDNTGLSFFDLVRFHSDSSELKYGRKLEWEKLYAFIKDNTFESEKNYYAVDSLIDMVDFIRLMAFVSCSEYYTWTWGISMYRPTDPVGKWKFSFWDADRSYTDINWDAFTQAQTTSGNYWGNRFPKRLLVNPEFRRLQVNGICDLLNSTFKPAFAVSKLDSLYSIIKPEVPGELTRWNPTNNLYDSNVESLRANLRNRPGILLNQIRSFFNLTTQYTASIDVKGHGTVKLNTLHLKQFPWAGNYFDKNAIDLEAVPDSGYKFVGWNAMEINPVAKLKSTLSADATYTAIFEKDTNTTISNIIMDRRIKIYPNPFSSGCKLAFFLNKGSSVDISLYSLNGEKLSTIFSGYVEATTKILEWNGFSNGKEVPKGAYIVKMTAQTGSIYQKIIKL